MREEAKLCNRNVTQHTNHYHVLILSVRLHQEAEGCAAGVPWRWCVGKIQSRGGTYVQFILYVRLSAYS